MPGVEVDLNTVGGNILLFILPGLLFSLVGFFLIWIGIHYFKTGILFGTIITENDKASGATWAIIIGSLFSAVGLSCVYIATKGIFIHFTSSFNAIYLAFTAPALFVLAYAFFIRWYWHLETEEPIKQKETN